MARVEAAASSGALRLRLDEGLAAMAIELSDEQRQKLIGYVTLLDKWNKVYNLTAVRESERMIGLHILDSLAVLPRLDQIGSLLDVGTGAGLPGIPLAIARPDMGVTMLDSLQKKATFVRQSIGELELSNASVVCERVERYQPKKKYDAVVSRAFADIVDFVKGAAHLLAPGGRLLAMKGVYPQDEIARLPDEMTVTAVFELIVPQIEGERHLVVIEKK